MLTLPYVAWCLPAAYYEAEGSGPKTLGQPNTLTAALVAGGQCRLDGQPLEEGAMVLAPGPLTLDAGRDCRLEGLALAGAAPNKLAAQLHGPLVLAGEAYRTAAGLVHWLVQRESSADAAGASELAYALLCRVCAASAAGEDETPALVAGAMQQMREHYGEVYGIEELADGLGVSKSHLIRVFRAATGTSPGRFLTRVRVEAAQRLLLRPEYGLETIAGLCGFSGANYFCRVFKKETGQTPDAWRKQNAPLTAAPAPDEWEEALYL